VSVYVRRGGDPFGGPPAGDGDKLCRVPDSDDEKLELDWGDRAHRDPAHPDQPLAPPPPAPVPASGLAPRAPGAPAAPPRTGHGQPGDPAGMSDNLRLQLQDLFAAAFVKVRQFRESLQMLVGWDQANKYEVISELGRPIFWAMEQPKGLLGSLARNFNPFYRNVTECITQDGTVAMKVTFPWAFFFRRGEVEAWDGRPMGVVQQRWGWFRTVFEITTPGGASIASIEGPWFRIIPWRDWVFEVRQGARPVGRIIKKWSGWFQEAFSNADNFEVQFEPGVDGRMRQLMIAAALTLDLTQFEQPSEHRGNRSLLGRMLDD